VSSAAELCCFTEDGVSFAVNCKAEDYVTCNEGGLTLPTNNPLRLKRVNPSAKCLTLSFGWWMPQSLEIGGGVGDTTLRVAAGETVGVC
jgi:hypothetical protein